MASYCQVIYETAYNGGMGSNGLTSARHDVFAKALALSFPESFDPSVPEKLVYAGTKQLTDRVEGSPLDASKLVLSPTRTYALNAFPSSVSVYCSKYLIYFPAKSLVLVSH